MIYRIILPLILIFTFIAQGGTSKSNYETLSELARASAQATGRYMSEKRIDTSGVMISDHPANVLIRNELVALQGIHFSMNNTKSTRLEIEIADFAIRYFRYSESQDSLIREAQILIKGILQTPTEPMRPLPAFTKILRDTIARADIATVENPGYIFTKALVPEQEKGLLSEIAEPLVLFTVAAISVLLLFSIRSQ